jgi:TetR/AcrR family transcriptional regulator, cholesterol catabolism regulator
MTQSPESVTVRAPSGRTIERRNRDEEVLEAAIKIMATKGYAAMTIQEVADDVGVLKGSLYHYFSSKEDLLFRVIADSYAKAAAAAEEVAALGLKPVEELFEYLRGQVHWYLSQPDRAKIYFSEARHLKGERLEQMKQRADNYEAYILALVVAAQEDGSIKSPIDPRVLCRFVEGALQGIHHWRGEPFRSRSHEELAEDFLTLTRHALQVQS